MPGAVARTSTYALNNVTLPPSSMSMPERSHTKRSRANLAMIMCRWPSGCDNARLIFDLRQLLRMTCN